MAKRNKAKKMAARGATAKEIRQATGVKGAAARNIVKRATSVSPSATDNLKIAQNVISDPGKYDPGYTREAYAANPDSVIGRGLYGGGLPSQDGQSYNLQGFYVPGATTGIGPNKDVLFAAGPGANQEWMNANFGPGGRYYGGGSAEAPVADGTSASSTQSSAAPQGITRAKAKQIFERTGGDVAKTTARLAKRGLPVVAGAANFLIKKAGQTPQAGAFGTSGLGQYLQGMAGTAGLVGPRNPQSGAPSYTVPSIAGTGKIPRGMQILPGGKNIGVIPRGVVTPQGAAQTTPVTPPTETTPTEVVNPYQDVINALAGIEDTVAFNDQYMQDYINQITQDAQLQSQQMSEMFNAQLAQQDAAYQQQVAQANLLAQQEQEAARAFMINQGRMINPANLQIGTTYGSPQLAGTQGFKYRPQTTTASMMGAFTAPTLAAAAMTPQQQLQPTVLNV